MQLTFTFSAEMETCAVEDTASIFMIRKIDIEVVQLILTSLKKEKECVITEKKVPLMQRDLGKSRSMDLHMSLC